MFDRDDLDTLPPSLTAALRRDVAPARGRAAAVGAVMDAVRAAPRPQPARGLRSRLLSMRPMRPRWALRRGALSPAGAMLAACLTLAVGWLGALGGQRAVAPGSRVAGGPAAAGAVRPSVIRDSILDNAIVLAIRDTVRMDRFALEAPTATRVAIVGDFNGWGARSVPLRRFGSGWQAEVPLRAGSHKFGFVVDDSQWVGAARAAVRGFAADTLTLGSALVAGDTI